MRLQIENFAKINRADITIDGITVIAGKNDTGKSTIGKVLFSSFNASADLEKRILQERKRVIQRQSRMMLINYLDTNIRTPLLYKFSRDLNQKLFCEKHINYDKVKNIVFQTAEAIFEGQWIDDSNEVCTLLSEKVYAIVTLPSEKLRSEVISRYFNQVFNEQVNSLCNADTKAKVELNVKNKKIEIIFDKNMCSGYQSEVELVKKAVYIDNPFIMDKLLDGFKDYTSNLTEMFLRDLLSKKMDTDLVEGIIESVIAKEKLEDIYRTLSSVIPGNLVKGQDDKYFLEYENFVEPIDIINLSTGIKSFLIIKILLEYGIINEKDILILDEPEIHLHPEWQLIYAEIIVLLQKSFDLNIIVTTHSRDFLEAIELYSKKHAIDLKCNYYMSNLDNNGVVFENVTGNIEKIYAQMVSPSMLLDNLRYELEIDEDE